MLLKPRLDLRDRQILRELDRDARQPAAAIGKRLGLSPEVVFYRIRRLEAAGVITQYQVIVNLAALGIVQFKLLLAFRHLSSAKLRGILVALREKPEVKWMASCRGSWDLLLALETDTLAGVARLTDEVLLACAGHIERKAISLLVEAATYSREYLAPGQQGRTRFVMRPSPPALLDGTDRRILGELAKNARTPVVELSRRLGLTARVVQYRIRQLEKQGIILGYKVALDYGRLGIRFFKAFISVDAPEPERLRSLVGYFERHPNIIHHVRVLGNWDLEPEFEVASEEELDAILAEMKDAFADIIRSVEVVSISREHKFVYF